MALACGMSKKPNPKTNMAKTRAQTGRNFIGLIIGAALLSIVHPS
jgi:hypothetical protein